MDFKTSSLSKPGASAGLVLPGRIYSCQNPHSDLNIIALHKGPKVRDCDVHTLRVWGAGARHDRFGAFCTMESSSKARGSKKSQQVSGLEVDQWVWLLYEDMEVGKGKVFSTDTKKGIIHHQQIPHDCVAITMMECFDGKNDVTLPFPIMEA